MGKQAELARIVSGKIWRTVVVAGAMLGTPIAVTGVAGCGGGAQTQQPTTPTQPDTSAQDKAAADKAAADQAAADKAAADKAAADQAAADQAAADKAAADKAAADQAAADAAAQQQQQPRPRSNGSNRPIGRGFVLA